MLSYGCSFNVFLGFALYTNRGWNKMAKQSLNKERKEINCYRCGKVKNKTLIIVKRKTRLWPVFLLRHLRLCTSVCSDTRGIQFEWLQRPSVCVGPQPLSECGCVCLSVFYYCIQGKAAVSKFPSSSSSCSSPFLVWRGNFLNWGQETLRRSVGLKGSVDEGEGWGITAGCGRL